MIRFLGQQQPLNWVAEAAHKFIDLHEQSPQHFV